MPIGTSPEAGSVLMSCGPQAGDPRPSVTDFEVVERYPRHTLVRAHPRTGRNHQIRLHFAIIGHPIVGDEFYGPFGQIKLTKAEYETLRRQPSNGRAAGQGDLDTADGNEDEHGSRHALHAHRLEFAHPILGGRVAFESPLPADLQSMALQVSTS